MPAVANLGLALLHLPFAARLAVASLEADDVAWE